MQEKFETITTNTEKGNTSNAKKKEHNIPRSINKINVIWFETNLPVSNVSEKCLL